MRFSEFRPDPGFGRAATDFSTQIEIQTMPRTPKDRRFRTAALAAAVAFALASAPGLASDASDKARALLEKGETRAAIVTLKGALQQDPTDAAARLLLGQIYLDTRDGAAAEKELLRAADLGTHPSAWRFELVEALLMQGKSSDALERLEQIGQEGLTPEERARSLALLGKANLGLNQLDTAEQLFGEALALQPENEDATLGKIVLATRNDRPDEAAALADRLLAQAPDNLKALLIRGYLFLQGGGAAEAAERFARAMELAPEDIRAILSHARAMVATGNFKQARADLDRADKIQQGITLTHYLRGAIAFEERDWERARAHLQRALKGMPGDLGGQFMLGAASFQLGELEAAEEYLSRVVASGGSWRGTPEAGKFLGATRLRLGEPQKAIEVLEPIIRGQEPPDPESMALLGTAYKNAGDPQKAREWLERSVEVSPDFGAGRTQLALTLLASGDTERAIGELEKTVDAGQDTLEADRILILAHIQNQDFDKALAVSRALEQRLPDSPVAAALTGLALLAKGDREGAREGFSRALTLDPAHADAALELARMDAADGDLESAQRRYESLLASTPGQLGAMLGLAALANQRGDVAGLVSWLEKAGEANRDDPQPGLLLANHYIAAREADKAQSVASRLAARFPGDPRVLETQGRAQLLAADFSGAARALETLVELEPDRPRFWYLLGAAEWGAEDITGARAAFTRAVELDPAFVDARAGLARVELKAGRLEQALSIAEELQKDHPDQAAGYALAGSVRLAQGRPEEAVTALEAAYEKGKDPDALRQLALAYGRAGRLGEAVTLLEAWTGEHPADRDALLLLAMYYQAGGRSGPLLETYETLAALDPDNAVVLNNLATAYQEAGDPRAVDTARRAYELAPEVPEIADTLGWLLVQSGQVGEGLRLLQEAYTRSPDDGEIGFHVAVALGRAERKEESVKLLERLLLNHPNLPQGAEARALLQELGK